MEWRKSSHSGTNGQCTECARHPDGGMAVRDSKHPDGPALRFSADEWQAFIKRAKLGK